MKKIQAVGCGCLENLSIVHVHDCEREDAIMKLVAREARRVNRLKAEYWFYTLSAVAVEVHEEAMLFKEAKDGKRVQHFLLLRCVFTNHYGSILRHYVTSYALIQKGRDGKASSTEKRLGHQRFG